MIALSNVTPERGCFVPLSAGLISCILPEETGKGVSVRNAPIFKGYEYICRNNIVFNSPRFN